MIKKLQIGIILFTFIFVAIHAAISCDECCGDNVLVANAWARIPKSPSNNTAIYFNITNYTGKDISLVSVNAKEVTDSAVLHESYVDESGIGRMNHVNKILLPHGIEIKFAPQKTHIMLFNLQKKLSAGDRFNLYLNFDNGLSVKTEVLVGPQPVK